MSTGGEGDHREGNDKDTAVAKTAGFVVFSGIAMSILKALNPCNKNNNNNSKSCFDSTPSLQESKLPPLQEPIKEPVSIQDPPPTSSAKTIDIVKGDTLWGFSRKYEVSIDAIKEANGLTGDTIYAGKKLVIP